MNLKKIVEKSQPYKDYEQYKKELDHYRNFIQPMTDEEANKFRHTAAAAAMARKYNPLAVNALGILKEADDYFLQHKSGKDSMFDLLNNAVGSFHGTFYDKSAPRRSLYDHIYNECIKK